MHLNMDTSMKTMCTKIHRQDLQYNILCKRGILTKTSVCKYYQSSSGNTVYSCVVFQTYQEA